MKIDRDEIFIWSCLFTFILAVVTTVCVDNYFKYELKKAAIEHGLTQEVVDGKVVWIKNSQN